LEITSEENVGRCIKEQEDSLRVQDIEKDAKKQKIKKTYKTLN